MSVQALRFLCMKDSDACLVLQKFIFRLAWVPYGTRGVVDLLMVGPELQLFRPDKPKEISQVI
jgi:hypothetical protein